MRLFVYGTLMKGFPNHGYIRDAGGGFISDGVTEARFDMISLGGFPGMVYGECRVRGEIWNISGLEAIDQLEGFPDFYDRSVISIFTLKGKLGAWAYRLNRGNPIFYGEETTNIGIVEKSAMKLLSYKEPVKYWIGEEKWRARNEA